MNVICVIGLSSLRQVWKSIARHFIRRKRNNGVCRYKTLTPINTSILNILKLSSYVFPNTFMYFLISDHSNCIGNILWYPSKTRLWMWKSITEMAEVSKLDLSWVQCNRWQTVQDKNPSKRSWIDPFWWETLLMYILLQTLSRWRHSQGNLLKGIENKKDWEFQVCTVSLHTYVLFSVTHRL